jgi:hypothetical protein
MTRLFMIQLVGIASLVIGAVAYGNIEPPPVGSVCMTDGSYVCNAGCFSIVTQCICTPECSTSDQPPCDSCEFATANYQYIGFPTLNYKCVASTDPNQRCTTSSPPVCMYEYYYFTDVPNCDHVSYVSSCAVSFPDPNACGY